MTKPKKSKLESDIEILPDIKKGMAVKWTLEQNAMILKYYETKGLSALAKVMKVASSTLRKQYLKLKEDIK